jgi:hypothetical protein
MRLATDEARNRKAQAFERSVRCDRARQLRRFPTVPKRRIAIDK